MLRERWRTDGFYATIQPVDIPGDSPPIFWLVRLDPDGVACTVRCSSQRPKVGGWFGRQHASTDVGGWRVVGDDVVVEIEMHRTDLYAHLQHANGQLRVDLCTSSRTSQMAVSRTFDLMFVSASMVEPPA